MSLRVVLRDAHKIYRSVRFAVKGFSHAYRSDRSFHMEVNYGLPIYVALGYFLWPFQMGEFLIFFFSYIFILTVELVNTSIELLLDRLHPEQHELIGKSKDVASAAVGVSLIFAVIVVGALCYSRFLHETKIFISNTFV